MRSWKSIVPVWVWLVCGALLFVGVALAVQQRWLVTPEGPTAGSVPPDEDDHHGPDHAGHSDATSIELSDRALRNIGFRPVTVEIGPFTRMTTLPAMVIERPGRSQVHVTAPLTGLVTEIVPIQGAAVEPGSELFEVRLTHEEIVATQRDLLRSVESLAVVNREIERLQSLGEGIVAGKRVLEQEYEQQKLEAAVAADRQALVLHGISEQQVDEIIRNRKLLQSLKVFAPDDSHEGEACNEDHLFHVQELLVKLGEQVTAGQLLCVLADHCELYIEGQAFADDARRLRQAAREGWTVVASLTSDDGVTELVRDLELLYLADRVDAESRAFRFYLSLPNEIGLDHTTPDGQRFIDWRFKPGQRLELRVPVEEWEDSIVLPVQAVVDEGAEAYVYRQNGQHFDQVPVTVAYRDRASVVIANDGALFPGDVVAGQGAYQMHLALKNQAGGGVDPHAGHSH